MVTIPRDIMTKHAISWILAAALLLISVPALAQTTDWRVTAMGGGGGCGSPDRFCRGL